MFTCDKILTGYTLGTLALVQATVLLKCSYVEILVHWSEVWCLLASARSHPRRFTAPPWLPQGENPRSLDIWVTRPWDIWIVGLQDNRDIGLWDVWKLNFWMFEILAFRLMGSLFNNIYALLKQMSQTMHFLHRLFASKILTNILSLFF